ncbi:MAG: hypothetical protein LLF90_03560 [Methanomicrobiaceae archaeon]|nr:hypothetical protein [Methanomicrobiaceae archaeon]
MATSVIQWRQVTLVTTLTYVFLAGAAVLSSSGATAGPAAKSVASGLPEQREGRGGEPARTVALLPPADGVPEDYSPRSDNPG